MKRTWPGTVGYVEGSRGERYQRRRLQSFGRRNRVIQRAVKDEMAFLRDLQQTRVEKGRMLSNREIDEIMHAHAVAIVRRRHKKTETRRRR